MEDINPVQNVPVQDVPVQDVPVQDAPVQDAPVQDAPVQDVPDAPVHSILDDVYAYQHADIKTNVMDALSGFYKSHVEGSIQVFHSLTVGEAAIVVMLAAILLVLVFKWIWEVVRSA
ncbi:hypothetical protein [Paenibacillus polymyxa]|uniref:hypothetical protein n=1 Tax=Paenibacillus polymyxa TaxID=1406 RepID=UPI0021E3C9DC|nr:hypothetical protein [Paenibacillus polymyxa]